MKAWVRAGVVVVVLAVAYSTGLLGQAQSVGLSFLRAHQSTSATGAPAMTDSPSAYAFAATDNGAPVTWDACAPVRLIINTTGAPAGALEDLKDAVADIANASGLKLQILATTTATPVAGWGERKSAGYTGWAPVLVGWVSPDTGLLDSNVAGRTTTVRAGGSYVSGMIVFNAALDANRPSGSGRPETRGAIYRHELGHLVGLAHVNNIAELMNPNAAFESHIADGDRTGLHLLGAQPCKAPASPGW